MDNNTLNYAIEKTKEMIAAKSCNTETRAAAEQWLEAAKGESPAAATAKYISMLEGCIMPVESLIAFAESEGGAAVFGANAKNVAAHGREIEAAGAKYCDCAACAAAEAILKKKELLLK